MRQQVRTLGVVLGSAALFSFVTLSSSRVQAGTQTAALAVSATVANNCTISTAPVAFGSYDPVDVNAAANLDGAGTVTIACTKGSTTPIDLDLGANEDGTTRRMVSAGNFLTYELYTDATRADVWGTGVDGQTPPAAPNKNARAFTVYGRVPSGQDVPAGSYADSITATVNFEPPTPRRPTPTARPASPAPPRPDHPDRRRSFFGGKQNLGTLEPLESLNPETPEPWNRTQEQGTQELRNPRWLPCEIP